PPPAGGPSGGATPPARPPGPPPPPGRPRPPAKAAGGLGGAPRGPVRRDPPRPGPPKHSRLRRECPGLLPSMTPPSPVAHLRLSLRSGESGGRRRFDLRPWVLLPVRTDAGENLVEPVVRLGL